MVSLCQITGALVSLIISLTFLVGQTSALKLDLDDQSSIVAAINSACNNALTFYHGDEPGNTPGIPDPPHYWWQAGGLFGLLIQRWSITGNSSLNTLITQGIQHQVGNHQNFEPVNQTASLGNDDQVFWAWAAMDAAELGFPDPPEGDPSWVGLAQAVFNRQIRRFETAHCGGGLRWQIFPFNAGYEYKNVISNGGLFQLAARLARYTGNETYAEHAEKMWDWIVSSALYDNSTTGLHIWDGIRTSNCSAPDRMFWTYNPGTLLMGAAYMYNYTDGADIWRQRLTDLLPTFNIYHVPSLGANQDNKLPEPAKGNIISEVACERPTPQTCDQDQPSFKGYTSRWLAMTTILAPFTAPTIWPRLRASAVGAAAQCIGNGPNQPAGTSCGRRWYQTSWDGFSGLGEHMSAMSVFQSLIIGNAKPPMTLSSGATSPGNPGAGGGSPDSALDDPILTNPILTRDKIGAALLTILACMLVIGGGTWMVIE